MRHADQLLVAISGVGLTDQEQQQIIDLVVSSQVRTPYQVRLAAQAAIMVIDPEAAARRFEKAKKNRSVFTDAGNDSAQLTALGSKGQIAQLWAAIDAHAGPKQPGDDRTVAQRRFDALTDLVCGRAPATSWQALIVVSLTTLEGGDEPAEIPGFGLVCASEARELLANAELRRVVVDEHGTLVSVDGHTHTPDQNPDQAAGQAPGTDPAQAGCGHSRHEPDPDPDPDLETLPIDDPGPDLAEDQHEPVEELVGRLTSNLETQLRAFLDEHVLSGATAGAGVGRGHEFRPSRLIEINLRHEPPDDPGGGSGPPDPPEPEPEPPSEGDRLWNDETLDRAAWDHHDGLTTPTRRFEPETADCPLGCPPHTPTSRRGWTQGALTQAHHRLTTDKIDTRPLESDSYPFSPRIARFLKIRDITCTFPGCPRLARDCQSDHVIPWPQGPTRATNGSSECTHHHQAKHHYFTVQKHPDGTLQWDTPLGRSYLRRPRPLLRGW